MTQFIHHPICKQWLPSAKKTNNEDKILIKHLYQQKKYDALHFIKEFPHKGSTNSSINSLLLKKIQYTRHVRPGLKVIEWWEKSCVRRGFIDRYFELEFRAPPYATISFQSHLQFNYWGRHCSFNNRALIKQDNMNGKEKLNIDIQNCSDVS